MVMLENTGPGLIVPDSDAQIAEELEKIRKAVERIREIQKSKQVPLNPLTPVFPTFPTYPPFDPYKPSYPWPIPNGDWFTTSCSVCGMTFKGSMGYVCQRVDCPSGVSCTPTK